MDRTILFGTGIYDTRAVVRKFGKFNTILLAQKLFIVSAFSSLVYLNCFIALRCHQKLARVVIIETQNVRLRSAIFYVVAPKQLRPALAIKPS